MNTPYTTRTGIRIGSRVEKTQRPEFDRDALLLQDALLCNARRTDWEGIAIVAATLIGIGFAFWVSA